MVEAPFLVLVEKHSSIHFFVRSSSLRNSHSFSIVFDSKLPLYMLPTKTICSFVYVGYLRYVQPFLITLHYITLHYIASHRIASHHITSHHITSHHITSHHITSHHIALQNDPLQITGCVWLTCQRSLLGRGNCSLEDSRPCQSVSGGLHTVRVCHHRSQPAH